MDVAKIDLGGFDLRKDVARIKAVRKTHKTRFILFVLIELVCATTFSLLEFIVPSDAIVIGFLLFFLIPTIAIVACLLVQNKDNDPFHLNIQDKAEIFTLNLLLILLIVGFLMNFLGFWGDIESSMIFPYAGFIFVTYLISYEKFFVFREFPEWRDKGRDETYDYVAKKIQEQLNRTPTYDEVKEALRRYTYALNRYK